MFSKTVIILHLGGNIFTLHFSVNYTVQYLNHQKMVPFFQLLSFNSKHRTFFCTLFCDIGTASQQVISFLSGFLMFLYIGESRWRMKVRRVEKKT